jgi:tetratricopeptide (TPR) repeat protein
MATDQDRYLELAAEYRYEEALAFLDEWRQGDPEARSPEMATVEGWLLMQAGDLALAKTVARDAFGKLRTPLAAAAYAEVLLEGLEFDVAEEVLRPFGTESPRVARTLARISAARGDLNAAADLMATCFERDPSDEAASVYLAFYRALLNAGDAYIGVLRQKLREGNQLAAELLLIFFRDAKRLQEAKTVSDQCLELGIQSLLVYEIRSTAQRLTGDLEGSLATAVEGRRRFPRSEKMVYLHARALYALRRYPAAADAIRPLFERYRWNRNYYILFVGSLIRSARLISAWRHTLGYVRACSEPPSAAGDRVRSRRPRP